MKTVVRLFAALICFNLAMPAYAVPVISLERRASTLENSPTNVSVITAEEIKATGATNLSDIIGTVPGVKTETSGSIGSFSSLKIRGVTTSNQIQVLIDDQPLGGSSVEDIDIGIIPLSDVERIEVVRGGASSLYGANTIGGVVHIITKKTAFETPLTGTIGYEGQSFQTHIQTNEVQAANGMFRGFLSSRRFNTQGYQNNSDGVNSTVSGSVGMKFMQDATADLDYSVTQQEQGVPSGTPVAFKDWNGDREREANTPTDRIDKKTERERLRVVLPLSHVLLQTVGHNYVDTRDFTSFFPSYSRNTITGNDTRAMFDFGLTVGASYERDERHAREQDPHHITSIGSYVEQSIKISRLTLIPAIRWDQHSKFGNEYNPRFSFVFHANDNLKISGNASRAVRAPTLTNLFENFPDMTPAYSFFGNPNLKPEHAVSYDLGTEVTASDAFTFGVTGFYTRIKDRIVAVNSDNLLGFFGEQTDDTLANVSKAEVSGAEAELKFRVGPLLNKANYTYQRGKGTSVASTNFVDLRLTPRHMINYELDLGLWKDSTLINTYRFVSHQFAGDNMTGTYIPPQNVWNIRLNQNVGQNLALFVGVDNVTDELYAESATFGNDVPMPTRTYKGGASVTFR